MNDSLALIAIRWMTRGHEPEGRDDCHRLGAVIGEE